ncbi:rhodanese-like domain-containing protein 4, chloroplastic [Silene latifolia]|uniref:rhodanese-like domain-containing protein 4, chloroplastic n=1 Tax=Silene latifolia TaxID=37657 RepID=UPI003D784256
MEALNAIGLKPICVLPNQTAKPKNPSQTFPFFKFPNPKTSIINPENLKENLANKFHGSLVLLASGLGLSAKVASALTYEEALEQTVGISSGADFDAGSVVETIVNNPILVAGGVSLIAFPLLLSQILGGKPKAFGAESAKSAYAKLGDDPNAQLLDIRPGKDVREAGSPDIKGLKKKPVSVVYNGEDKPGFLQKLSLKFKEPENTTLYILDKFDGNAELVAELVTSNGFKSAYAIKDGAEGPRGWLNSGLPWIQPSKGFKLDFGGLTDGFGDITESLPVTVGLAAVAAGVGILTFTEIETVLQLLGSAAIIQVVSKKLLFAEDRKQTLQQFDEFLTTKIAPNELVSDIKQIGTALLPISTSRALPAPTEATAIPETPAEPTPEPVPASPTEATAIPEPPAQPTPEPVPAAGNDVVFKFEASTESPAQPEPEPEASAQPASEINSVPQNETKPVSHPRPLSPYAAYPDFKPPSSPCPSQP